MIVFRDATREDLNSFQTNWPTTEGLAADLDGKLIGIGGFAHYQGRVWAFLNLTPEARPFKVTLHRAALDLMKRARARGFFNVYAQTDGSEPTADRWLKRLGFAPQPPAYGKGLYRWQPSRQS